ncbi:MAG: hypothetical protein ABS916_07820 [Carnobacterium sp.]|mgnify:CR=1 FL=1|uniref:hypothetical protein n=1 Tax=Carnobacterium sp. TaxID=48221 RepID=UPI0033151393
MSDKVKKFLKTFAYYYLPFVVVLLGTRFIFMLNNKETIKNAFNSEFLSSFVWAIPLLLIGAAIKVFVIKNRGNNK